MAKQNPSTDHPLSKCPWVSATTRSDLQQTLPQLCVGCLYIKQPTGVHTCPPQFKEGGVSSRYFCAQCKCKTKLCRSPTTHSGGHIPATFAGAAVRMDTEVDGEIAAWTLDSINKGTLGSSTLLTSSITLVKEGETIQVNCLWDSGSESRFFSPALLPFATNQRQTSFEI